MVFGKNGAQTPIWTKREMDGKKNAMKSIALCFVAVGVLAFLSGCAGGDGYYTPSQRAAQHGVHDPTTSVYGY